jgi:hypothetical protein
MSVGFDTKSTDLDVAVSPRAFFKKGRVFMTLWTEPSASSPESLPELAHFAVIKPKATFSVCLRISTHFTGGDASDHAAIIVVDGAYSPQPRDEHSDKDPIQVKLEKPGVTIDPKSRINFAKPYTVEHNVKICNVGRVIGASVGLLDQYFAESLGHTKPG